MRLTDGQLLVGKLLVGKLLLATNSADLRLIPIALALPAVGISFLGHQPTALNFAP
ncbi:hypothetical protein AAKU55_001739 [Oxalobacteraceae bacterium GrIS 1.11]